MSYTCRPITFLVLKIRRAALALYMQLKQFVRRLIAKFASTDFTVEANFFCFPMKVMRKFLNI